MNRLIHTSLIAILLPIFLADLLLFTPGFATSQAPEQDAHQVFLPLVPTTPQDISRQFLNSIGGSDNIFHTANSLVFLGRGHDLAIVDVTAAQNPVLHTKIQLPAIPFFMTVQDDYAFLTLGDSGLAILDLTEPSQAYLLSRLPLEGTSRSLLLSNGIAYISSSQALYVVDISQPANPRLLGSVAMNAGSAQFHESLLLVSTEQGFALVDAGLPTNPVIVGVWESYWSYGIVAVNGSFVYQILCSHRRLIPISMPS